MAASSRYQQLWLSVCRRGLKPGHGERRGGNEEKPWPEAAESTQAPSDEETRSNTWLEIVVTLTHST